MNSLSGFLPNVSVWCWGNNSLGWMDSASLPYFSFTLSFQGRTQLKPWKNCRAHVWVEVILKLESSLDSHVSVIPTEGTNSSTSPPVMASEGGTIETRKLQTCDGWGWWAIQGNNNSHFSSLSPGCLEGLREFIKIYTEPDSENKAMSPPA